MLFSAAEIQAAACSPEERAVAARLADTLSEMAETVSQDGLYALGRYAADQAGFLGECIDIVLDNSDGARKALREAALAGGEHGRALLERFMSAQGLAGIAGGEGAALIQLKMKAYAGLEFFIGERREKAIRGYVSLGFARDAAEQLADIN
jgi:hypothetical protein